MRLENWHPEVITAEIEKQAMDRLETAAGYLMGRARQLVPVGQDRPGTKGGKDWTARKAGALRDTIRVVRLKGDPKQNVRVYAGNTREVFYSHFVEYGTVKMKAKPFLRPALNEVKNRIKSILENG